MLLRDRASALPQDAAGTGALDLLAAASDDAAPSGEPALRHTTAPRHARDTRRSERLAVAFADAAPSDEPVLYGASQSDGGATKGEADLPQRMSGNVPADERHSAVAVRQTLHAKMINSLLNGTAVGDSVHVDKLREMLTFDGCEELLRGTYLRSVMRGGGRIFNSSKGQASTYALSKPVLRIQAFLSHNWAVGRWTKLWCLAYHFNARLAVVGACLVLFLCSLTGYFDVLPTYYWAGYHRGYLGRVLTIPVVLIMAVFGRDLLLCFPCFRGPIVFLDKVCVHQTDMVLQQRAIIKLGAFLHVSDTMVVCYTDLYLTKLWTVYELASYLSLWHVSRLKVIHGAVPIGFFIIAVTSYVIDLAALGAAVMGASTFLAACIEGPTLFLLAILFRKVQRSHLLMEELLAKFSVHNCTCFVEEDKAVVFNNIIEMMQPGGARLTDDEALTRFEQMVRQVLPKAMATSFGSRGVHRRSFVWLSFIRYWPRVCDGLATIAHGTSWRHFFIAFVLYYVCFCAIVLPLASAVTQHCATMHIHRTERRVNLFFICCGVISGTAVILVGVTILKALEEVSLKDDNNMFVAYLCFTIGGIVLSQLCIRRRLCCRCCRKGTGDELGLLTIGHSLTGSPRWTGRRQVPQRESE